MYRAVMFFLLLISMLWIAANYRRPNRLGTVKKSDAFLQLRLLNMYWEEVLEHGANFRFYGPFSRSWPARNGSLTVVHEWLLKAHSNIKPTPTSAPPKIHLFLNCKGGCP